MKNVPPVLIWPIIFISVSLLGFFFTLLSSSKLIYLLILTAIPFVIVAVMILLNADLPVSSLERDVPLAALAGLFSVWQTRREWWRVHRRPKRK